MDSVLRGWVIGHLLGEAISRRRDAQPHWGAIAYSEITGMAWAYNHRSAHAAEHAALARCQGPRTRLWACGTNITIAVARGPRGAFACHWADPRLTTHAATGAIAKCQATYPTPRPRPPPRLARPGPRRPPRRPVSPLTPRHPPACGRDPGAPPPNPRHRFGDHGRKDADVGEEGW